MRSGNWKLVAEQKKGWELYDLSNDRVEIQDLAVKYPEVLADMTRKYKQWAKRVGVVKDIGKKEKKEKKKTRKNN